MTTYAVGDVQGCFACLRELLRDAGFDPARDELWSVGDLVNRGPDSLATLRYFRDLGPKARIVLGNHDLHLLAIVFGGHAPSQSDTLGRVLDAPDCLELAHWLRTLPLLHATDEYAMTHAGIPHLWNLQRAKSLAREVEAAMQGKEYTYYFRHLYGNTPTVWDNALTGMDRLRLITNYFTRMRFINEQGVLDFSRKGDIQDAPTGFAPWFAFESRVAVTQIFGHWASINGVTGRVNCLGIDTGCVWGRALTLLRLEDGARLSRACDG